MTRFARAKGSKASNQRQVESSTSWQEMKPNKKTTEATGSSSQVELPKQKTSHATVNQKVHIKPRKVHLNIDKGKQVKNKWKNEGFQRRKPLNEPSKIFINGVQVEIGYYDGFPVKKSDYVRLKQLKKQMISRGIPRSEVAQALKLERRKAEKALAREKKKVCFNCRKSGHTLSECPMLKSGPDAQLSETGICFKCGSTEHTHFECKVTRGDNFKFAQCFICKEQGHIARQCPDNSKGLYPKGGACRVCGDVTHLKKDCPQYQAQQEESKVVADTINEHDIEALDTKSTDEVKPKKKRVNKIIKF